MSIEVGEKPFFIDLFEVWQILRDQVVELRTEILVDRLSGRNSHFQRINIFSVSPDSVIQMRTGRFSGVADITYNLTLNHPAAFGNSLGEFLKMTVAGDQAI